MFESAQVVDGARAWDRQAIAAYEADRQSEAADADLRRAIAKDGSDVYSLLNGEPMEDDGADALARLIRLAAAGADVQQLGIEFGQFFDGLVAKALA